MKYDSQYQSNLDRLRELREKGYQFAISADSYSVSLNGVFLGGGSVMLPRRKPLHWRHREGNIKLFVEQALLVAAQAKCHTV